MSYLVENRRLPRNTAVWYMTVLILVFSSLIIFNFDALFGNVIAFTTEYSQPLLGLLMCIFVGWVWRRDRVLEEVKSGFTDAEYSMFWKVWPWYVKFVCPLIIAVMFIRSVF